MLGEDLTSVRMADAINVKKKSLDGIKSPDLTSPPPTKKLKQARLPFKALPPKSASLSNAPVTKKRKLSDGATILPKAKSAKNDENNIKKSSKIDPAENEVSSSSEQSELTNKKPEEKKQTPKNVTLLDRFVRPVPTQQGEVSTSGEVIDLTDSETESKSSQKVAPPTEVTSSPAKDKESTCDKVEVVESKVSEEKQSLEKETTEVDVEDKENVSAEEVEDKSDTKKTKEDDYDGDDESDKDVSILSMSDGDTSIVTTEGEEASPAAVKENVDKTNATPTSAKTRPKTPRSSAKKIESEAEKLKRKQEKESRQKEREQKKEEARLERQKQKEEARLQRQKEKDEKEKQKQEEKEKKEKERMEAKLQKEKEKQEKLEEKQRQKEEKEKKKQEEIDAKNAEKKQKDDEKKKNNDEEKKKTEKAKQAFASFFTKTEKSAAQAKVSESSGLFIQFEVKGNMRLAPNVRRCLAEKDKSILDQAMGNQEDSVLYLDELKKDTYAHGCAGKTWPYERDDVEIVEDGAAPKPKTMRTKFLYFHQNYRPPYYGTMRKCSKFIRPRNPLGKDENLDYEVDSDDEWEEEDPGESLSHSEDEGEDVPAADDDDEEDDFFVPHGYLSEGEGAEDEEDMSPEMIKARQIAKAKAWESDMKKTCNILKPVYIGCMWWSPEGTRSDPNFDRLASYKVAPLSKATFPINTQSVDNPVEKDKKKKSKKGDEESKAKRILNVPDEAIPDLIRLVHGNVYSIHKLVKEFQVYWNKKMGGESENSTPSSTAAEETAMDVDTPDANDTKVASPPSSAKKQYLISKRQLDIKIRAIAVYEKRDCYKRICWYVNDSILEEHKMTDIAVPTDWTWLTRANNNPQKEARAGTPKSGRETPKSLKSVQTTPTAATNAPTIKQFTVTVDPSKLHAPTPQNPTSSKVTAANPEATPVTPSASIEAPLTGETPKRQKTPQHVNPMTLFKNMKLPTKKTGVVDNPTQKNALVNGETKVTLTSKTKEKRLKPANLNLKQAPPRCNVDSPIVLDDDSEDCVIVEEPPKLPQEPAKNQPTVFSMFSKK